MSRLSLPDGYETEVMDAGEGSALVLVHGTPLDARCWSGMLPALTARFRILAYDLRGHGTAAGCPLPETIEPLADDVAALLDQKDVERAHVVGHSFGGQVAQLFALRHPQRIGSLGIVCSRSAPFPAFAPVAEAILGPDGAAVRRSAVERWFSAGAIAENGEMVRYARARVDDIEAATYATALRMIAAFDVTDRLPGLTAPTYWIAARDDPVGAPAASAAAVACFADATLQVVEDAGHMLPLEHPDRVATLLTGFMDAR